MNFDIPRDFQRRDVLKLLGGSTVAVIVAGAAKVVGASTTEPPTSEAAGTAADSCTVIPAETAGPFPGDGSNGPDILSEADVVRRDITASIGDATGVADGVPLEIDLLITDTAAGCTPMEGAAVYLWHCDREGRYSMYSAGAENENYLRGVQVADADGKVVFDSIFPAAYQGRWPHIHFEIYRTVEDATSGGEPIATSQLAFPEDVCALVYATEGYEVSVGNLAATSLEQDGVFGDDGAVDQLATITGDVEQGIVAELAVGI